MNCNEHHAEAMRQADLAADPACDEGIARQLKGTAAMHEEDAARLADGVEPSRSVLYRSAAWMWMEANNPERALEMAALGLQGQPPDDIKTELFEVAGRALRNCDSDYDPDFDDE